MQENLTLSEAENKLQSPPVAADRVKTQAIEIDQLVGGLCLNLTQPECSDGGRNV